VFNTDEVTGAQLSADTREQCTASAEKLCPDKGSQKSQYAVWLVAN